VDRLSGTTASPSEDDNLIVAGALLALPMLIISFDVQRQFVRGLTLGATKG
jgi:ABC-type glycerol-3-phosphate transport system permease component